MRARLFPASLVTTTALGTAVASAASNNWIPNAGGVFDYATASNWSLGSVPTAPDTANFQLDTLGDQTINAPTATSINILKIGDTAPTGAAYSNQTFTGSPITFFNSAGTAGAGTLSSTNGANVVNNELKMSVTSTAEGLSVYSRNSMLTLAGVISGQGALYKYDSGTLVLSGSNTYSGGTNVIGGTLKLGADNVLNPAGWVQMNGNTTLDIGAFSQTVGSFSGPTATGTTGVLTASRFSIVGGPIAARLAGEGATATFGGTITAPCTYTGGTTIFGGLTLGASNVLPDVGAINVGSSTLDATLDLGTFSDSVGPVTFNGGSTLSGTGTATLASPSVTFKNGGSVQGSLTGTGSLLISSGSVTLSRNQTFTGGTIITSGATLTTLGSSMPDNGDVRVGGTYDLSGSDTIGSLTLSGGIVRGSTVSAGAFNLLSGTSFSAFSGSGGATKTGAGTVILTGRNTYAGETRVIQGDLLTQNSNVLPDSTSVIVEGGRLGINYSAATEKVGPVTLVNGTISPSSGALDAASYDVRSGTISVKLTGNGAMTKSTSGSVTLSSSNSYTGNTTIKAGTLIANDISLGAVSASLVFDGGTLQIPGAFTSSRPLAVQTAGGTFDTHLFAGSFEGTGSTGWAGNLSIVGSGALSLNRTGGTVSVTPGASITVSPGATLNIGGSIDPLSEGSNRVDLVNNSLSTLNILVGAKSVGDVTGVGRTVIAAGASLTANQVRQETLEIGGTLFVRSNGGDGATCVISNLNLGGNLDGWSATLDLNDNALVLLNEQDGPTGQTVTRRTTNQVKASLGGGNGISSSTALANPEHNTVLGVIQNNRVSAANLAGLTTDGTTLDATAGNAVYTSFAGQPVALNDTLVRYTRFGDANLDGALNSTDYNLIDSGFATGSSGWINGDFNYSGTINSTDYFLIDSTYLSLGNSLTQSVLNQRLASFGQEYVDALSALPSVPEPTIGLIAIPLSLLSRRKRNVQASA